MQGGEGSPIKNFLAGGFGGMCAGHPFDTIKVRLQTSSNPTTVTPKGVGAGVPSYASAFDCFRRTFVNEGIPGFYKGMGTPLLMVTPLFALGFFGYGVGKHIVSTVSKPPTPTSPMTPLQMFLAGAISGGMVSLVATPVERIKCLLQVQVQEGALSVKKYKGPANCAVVLWKEGGVQSLYRGFGATFVRGIPQSGLYFMTYESLKGVLLRREGEGTKSLTIAHTILAGGLTGIINWIFILPFDVVKSRVQTASPGQYPRGARDALSELLKTEGPKGLYRGIVPVFMRAFPANAACFMGFEAAMKVLNLINL